MKLTEIRKKLTHFIATLHNKNSLSVLLIFAGITIAALLGSTNVRADLPAPGGVDNGLVTWQKADDGTTNGTSTSWADSSGNSNNASRAGGAFLDNGINFNPAWNFTGAAAFAWSSNLGVVGTNNFSTIAALRHDEAVAGAYFGHASSSANNNFVVSSTATGASSAGRGGPGGTCTTTSSATEAVGIPRILDLTRTYPSVAAYLNGGGAIAGTCDISITGTNRMLGRRQQTSVGTAQFHGLIAEFSLYNRDLTGEELNRVNSYLAIKYGVTLDQNTPQNYTASDGTTIPWNATTNAAYRHNITGIGRDDSSALSQKQSKSVNPQGIVTIGHNTIESTNRDNPNSLADDLSFLMFGDNNNTVSSWVNTGVPALDTYQYKRIQRTWKVQKTGTIGDVTVAFDVNNPDADIIAPINGYYLINLTTGQATPLTSSNGNTYSASGITFSDGDLFTVGTSAAQYNVRYRKTVSPIVTSITPGQTFTYTVTVENLSNVPQTGLSFTDDLTNVVDDATYNNDVTSGGVGTPTWNGSDEISWSGNLVAGQTATITYSFTMNDPVTGNGALHNSIVGTGQGANCTEDPAIDPDCVTISPLPIVSSKKTLVSPATPRAGDVVQYKFTITNTGGAAAASVTAADDLTDVLDDAVFNGDQQASSGNVAYSPLTKRLSWSGSLAANGDPGDTVTVTFSVTVNSADTLGDAMLNNFLIAADCPNSPVFDPSDPGYAANCVTSTPIAAWIAKKSVSPAGDISPGDTVKYTIKVENTGAANLTDGNAPTIEDNLTDVLNNATYNNDAGATAGPQPTLAQPKLSWTGDLATGETTTITYSFTVDQVVNPVSSKLANTITGPMNCPQTHTSDPNDPAFNADCAALSKIAASPDPTETPEDVTSAPSSNENNSSNSKLAGTGQNTYIYALLAAILIIVGLTIIFRQKFRK